MRWSGAGLVGVHRLRRSAVTVCLCPSGLLSLASGQASPRRRPLSNTHLLTGSGTSRSESGFQLGMSERKTWKNGPKSCAECRRLKLKVSSEFCPKRGSEFPRLGKTDTRAGSERGGARPDQEG